MGRHTTLQCSREELVGLCLLQCCLGDSTGTEQWGSARLCSPQGFHCGARNGLAEPLGSWMCKPSLRPHLSPQPCSPSRSSSTAQVTQTSSPRLSWAPCHQVTHPTAASPVPVRLQLQPYKGDRAQGWKGAVPGASQPCSHGEQRFLPGPCPGPGGVGHPCGEEGTGTGDDGDAADMALGCSVGSQGFSLKCHFRLGKAPSPGNGQGISGSRPATWYHLHKTLLPQRHHAQDIPSPGVCAQGHHAQGIPSHGGLSLGIPCMLTGWDTLALVYHLLSSQQHLGEHFPKLGTGRAVPRSHTRSRACGSGCGAVGGMGPPSAPCTGAEGLWPCPFSASSAGCGGMSRTL